MIGHFLRIRSNATRFGGGKTAEVKLGFAEEKRTWL